jgi:hypothetical protein
MSQDDDARIVELFVRRRDRYDEPTVLRLTRATAAQLRVSIEEGEVEPDEQSGVRTFSWADVVHLALRRWTPRMISAALARAGARQALPLLNQTRTIPVELPLYQIRLLHWLAAESSEPGKPRLNASDILERQIDALVSGLEPAEATVIEGAIHGFQAASQFPQPEEAAPDVEERCLYCGSRRVSERGACASCAVLHERKGG